jgi:uncharacterized LabA/DUF88 family protein
MDLRTLKTKHYQDIYLFDPAPYGRIFTFVDFSNVRNWAKSFWPSENKEYLKKDIDIKKLALFIDHVKPIKKFFYYGHHKEHPYLPLEHDLNIKYRQSIYRIDKARDCGFITRTKDIKEINDFDGDGKFLGMLRKCNFDIEIAMDMLLKIEKYDTALLWSGDSDFHLLMQYLKSKKKKVITVCARDFVSKELRENSDRYMPADSFKEHLAFIKTTSPSLAAGREKDNPIIL